jgi:phosphatidylinositol glycan class B
LLIACALNTAIDRWLYGAWVCTPCNYFYMNIVMGKAATFSTEPWWFFLAQMLGLLVPPFSVILVALLAVSLWACRSNVLVWAVVPFLLGHNLLAHKEVRFLIPITYALVPLLVLGADRVPATIRAKVGAWQSRRAARWMFIALNSIALLIMTLKPSSETAIVFRRLYDESQKGPIVLYTDSPLPYLMSGKAVGFYRPENVTVMKVTNLEELRATMRGAPERVFLFQQSLQPPGWSAADGIACTPVARSIPVWAAKFNVNDWTSRLYLWSVFSVRTDATGGGC